MLCSDTIIDTRPPAAGLTMMQVESISEFRPPSRQASPCSVTLQPCSAVRSDLFGQDVRLLLAVLTCDEQLSTADLRPTSPVVRGDESKIRRQIRGQIEG